MSNLDDMHENGVHDYLKYIKFGYGRCTDHVCKDIRAGLMGRGQGIELPVAVRRTGVPPRHVLTTDLPDAVRGAAADLLREVDGTVGVVATQASRDAVAGWLAGLAPERLQTVTSLEAKGMEYDGVLVVEPAAILTESPAGRRTLYVALSRATQRLTTVGTDDSWRD